MERSPFDRDQTGLYSEEQRLLSQGQKDISPFSRESARPYHKDKFEASFEMNLLETIDSDEEDHSFDVSKPFGRFAQGKRDPSKSPYSMNRTGRSFDKEALQSSCKTDPVEYSAGERGKSPYTEGNRPIEQGYYDRDDDDFPRDIRIRRESFSFDDLPSQPVRDSTFFENENYRREPTHPGYQSPDKYRSDVQGNNVIM